MEDIKYNAKDNDVNMSSKNEESDQDVTADTETSRKRILVERFLPLPATTKKFTLTPNRNNINVWDAGKNINYKMVNKR